MSDLRAWVQHKASCASQIYCAVCRNRRQNCNGSDGHKFTPRPCTCGLDAALSGRDASAQAPSRPVNSITELIDQRDTAEADLLACRAQQKEQRADVLDDVWSAVNAWTIAEDQPAWAAKAELL